MLRIPRYTFLLLLLSCSIAYASTQGRLGATSTGGVNISITKPLLAEAVAVTPTLWGSGNEDASFSNHICIYSTTGNYRITAIGDGPDQKFQLASGTRKLSYDVVWSAGGGRQVSLNAGQPSNLFSGANVPCGKSQKSAQMVVNFMPAARQVQGASYTGTLTLMVTPF